MTYTEKELKTAVHYALGYMVGANLLEVIPISKRNDVVKGAKEIIKARRKVNKKLMPLETAVKNPKDEGNINIRENMITLTPKKDEVQEWSPTARYKEGDKVMLNGVRHVIGKESHIGVEPNIN